jgi:hypothetical protein
MVVGVAKAFSASPWMAPIFTRAVQFALSCPVARVEQAIGAPEHGADSLGHCRSWKAFDWAP